MSDRVHDSWGSAAMNEPATAAVPVANPRNLFWPIFLTSLIGIHIVSVVVMVSVATHDRSFAIEPDWYQQGLGFEQVVQQQRENSRLNWSVKLHVGQPQLGTTWRRITCRVVDAAGVPVTNAVVDLVAFAHLRASNRKSCVLRPRDAGQYEESLAFDELGIWEFRFVIKRGPLTFTHVVKQEI
jgi:nitrogen fixation protein FixH